MSRPNRLDPPPARKSAPTKLREDGTRIIDIDNYPPFFLGSVANAWQRRTGADYRARFGIGIVEWRVLSMLSIEPSITAGRICDVIRIDKAAASRALTHLSEKGLVVYEAERSDPRKRRWTVSITGRDLHEQVIAAALSHEADLVAGIPDADLEAFLRVMRRMLRNLDAAAETE